jgi:hypothetical protein
MADAISWDIEDLVTPALGDETRGVEGVAEGGAGETG